MSAQNSGRPAADVNNQPPLLAGHNAYLTDPLLKDIADALPRGLHGEFEATGKFTASAEAQDLARIANRSTPELRTHSPSGQRIDLVEFHPAYHALLRRSVSIGLQGSVWEGRREEKGFAHQARGIRFYLTAGLECGHLCPLTMTNASIAAIKPGVTTDQVAKLWPKAEEFGFPNEDAAFGLQFGHGLGLALHERPIISRAVSLDHPMEIQTGMVFALETYCPATDGYSAARIEEEVVVTEKGCEVISLFPAEDLPIANRY